MMRIIRQNWVYISFFTIIASFSFIVYKEKTKIEKPKVIYIKQPPKTPQTDSVFAVIDSVLKMRKENEDKKEELYKKKEMILKQQLKIEKLKKSKQPKTKVVVETKEVIVEKEVKVADPNTKELVKENYKTQQENFKLKEEIENLKRQNSIGKDSISTDTVRRKKKRFFLF